MSYGMKVIGDHGFTIIDDRYSNFVLVNTGTATVSGSTQGNGYLTTINVTLSPTSIVALGGTTRCVLVGQGQNTFSVFSNGTPGVSQFRWYVYDLPSSPSGDTVGVRIFRDDGKIAFDSGYEPLSVVGNANVSASSNNTNQEGLFLGGVSNPGNRTMAAACCNPAVAVWSGNPASQGATPNFLYTVVAVQETASGSLFFYNSRFETFGAGGNTNRSRAGTFLVIDVTNL